MSSPRHLLYPDAFKLVAILGVIVAHLPPGRHSPSAWAMVEMWQHATAWCVLAFFAVAGVLFRQGDSRPVRQQLRKRASRLLIPWATFSVLYKVAITGLAMSGLIQRAPLPPADIPGLLRWLTISADPQLYFLLYLFVIQALFLVLQRVAPLVPLVGGVLALAVWLWSAAESRSPEVLHGASLSLIPLYFAFFVAGTLCGSSLARVGGALAVFGAAGVALAAVVGQSWFIAWQLIAVWLLLLGLQSLEGTSVLRPLAHAGRLSGRVYVWHAPVIIGLASLISVRLLGDGLLSALATIAATFSAAALVGTAVNRLPVLRPFHI